MKLIPIGSLAAALTCASLSLHAAGIKYPTDAEIQGIRNLCAGGDVQSIDARLETALKAWRANPAVKVDVGAARKNLGAVLEKVTSDASGNALYANYVACVRDMIDKYLTKMNPTPVAQGPVAQDEEAASPRAGSTPAPILRPPT